ncbi:major facilitator superfamily domain-containing protein [Aspergillus aurantiobrunneus]
MGLADDEVAAHPVDLTPTSSNEKEEVVDVYPDGGLKAWLVALGAWCGCISAFGLMNSNGVFSDWLADHQLSHYDHSTISWIFSVHNFCVFMGGVQAGPLFDRYGPKLLLILGSLGLTAAVMAFSVATEFYQFMLSFGVLGGTSASMIFTPSIAVINHWFFKRRAIATGIVMTAGGIGGIIFPQIFSALAPKLGWGWAVRTLGFIVLVTSGTGTILQKTRLQPDATSQKTIDLRVLREPAFNFTTVAIVFVEIGFTIPIAYLTSYGSANAMSTQNAYALTPILNGASILGRLVPGFAADRYGRFNVMVITTAVSALVTLALWLTAGTNEAAIISYAALFGFWSGSAISLSPVCVAQISKTEDFGKRYGTCYTFVAVGVLVSLPIAGEILKAQTYGEKELYWGLILFAGLSYTISAVFFALARVVVTGWRWKSVF